MRPSETKPIIEEAQTKCLEGFDYFDGIHFGVLVELGTLLDQIVHCKCFCQVTFTQSPKWHPKYMMILAAKAVLGLPVLTLCVLISYERFIDIILWFESQGLIRDQALKSNLNWQVCASNKLILKHMVLIILICMKKSIPEMRTDTSMSPGLFNKSSGQWTSRKSLPETKTQSNFVRPYDFRSQFKMSKTKQNYLQCYKSVANETVANCDIKPHQISVSNYLTSQVSISGIASRKFKSITAERRLRTMPSISTDFIDYPLTNRKKTTMPSSKQINQPLSRR